MHEDDGSQAKCSGNCSGQAGQYNAVMYTLFQVNDTFVRANDTVLVQTKVFPVDASNYNASPPSYVVVGGQAGTAAPGTVISQTYNNATSRPTNMKTYHTWTNIANEPSGQIVARNGYNPPVSGSGNRVDCTSIPCTSVATPGALPPGTYRLRVDLLDANGNVSNSGSSNHGYALRVVKPGTNPEDSSPSSVCQGTVGSVTSNCTVSGWEDAVVSTPLGSSAGPTDNYIPLFQLPQDYAGSTIIVDLFDFGDVTGDNDVSIIDPTGSANCSGSPICGGVANASGLTITNMGINRNGPRLQHKCGPNSQCPDGAAPLATTDDVPHLISGNDASWTVARNGQPHPYNGTWIRVSIPISGSYAPASGKDYWYVRYHLSGTANDCFSFAVKAQGGPVHLLKS
jgi:hypothetical protein